MQFRLPNRQYPLADSLVPLREPILLGRLQNQSRGKTWTQLHLIPSNCIYFHLSQPPPTSAGPEAE